MGGYSVTTANLQKAAQRLKYGNDAIVSALNHAHRALDISNEDLGGGDVLGVLHAVIQAWNFQGVEVTNAWGELGSNVLHGGSLYQETEHDVANAINTVAKDISKLF